MPYAKDCLRGIPSEKQINNDGTVEFDVFLFDDKHVKPDGNCVQSINWNDNEGAILLTLTQIKEDGSIQFKGGYAVIATVDLDWIANSPSLNQAFNYERDRLPDNPYHGNLLLDPNTSQHIRKYIANALALRAIVKPRNT